MSSRPTTETRRAPLKFLGVACAIGVSTIYFNQPLLPEIGHSLRVTAGDAGFIAVATQVGYAIGLLSFVPLGDVLERRALMLRMYAAVTIGLALTAFAPNLACMLIFSVVIGALASVTHIVLPIAPDLVSHEERGRAIGNVMMGLLLGILLARSFAGWVSRLPDAVTALSGGRFSLPFWSGEGWRWAFLIAAIVNAIFLPIIARIMPAIPPRNTLRYADAMRSLWTLARTQPLLRESCVIGALIFGSFSCFWTTLAFLLGRHYHLGAGVAGSFGLVGAAGATVAPLAGRMADRRGTRFVLSVAFAVLASAFMLLWAGELAPISFALHMVVLVFGVILLDVGAQLAQVANQTRIFGLVPSARSRLNTVYMTTYFAGAAIGSALATVAWVHWDWNGVSALALLFVFLGIVRHLLGGRYTEAKRPTENPEETAPDPLVEI